MVYSGPNTMDSANLFEKYCDQFDHYFNNSVQADLDISKLELTKYANYLDSTLAFSASVFSFYSKAEYSFSATFFEIRLIRLVKKE